MGSRHDLLELEPGLMDELLGLLQDLVLWLSWLGLALWSTVIHGTLVYDYTYSQQATLF
jgi:hypothetical protein